MGGYEICIVDLFTLLVQEPPKYTTVLCGNKMPKMPTRCNRWFLLQIILLAQHVSGTTMPIIRSSRVLYKWLLPVVFGALVFKLSVWCGAEGCVSGLRTSMPRSEFESTIPASERPQTHVSCHAALKLFTAIKIIIHFFCRQCYALVVIHFKRLSRYV